jgi:hypothetical protein
MELETWSSRFSYILFLGGFALVEKWEKSGEEDWTYKLINRPSPLESEHSKNTFNSHGKCFAVYFP